MNLIKKYRKKSKILEVINFQKRYVWLPARQVRGPLRVNTTTLTVRAQCTTVFMWLQAMAIMITSASCFKVRLLLKRWCWRGYCFSPPPNHNLRIQLSLFHQLKWLFFMKQKFMELTLINANYFCQAQFKSSSSSVQLRTEISLIISVRPRVG